MHRHAFRIGRILASSLLLALFLVGCAGPGLAEPEPGEIDLRKLESRVRIRVNEYRVSVKKPPLESNEQVAKVARAHSRDMAKGRVGLGHDGLRQRAALLGASIQIAGLGENVSKHDRRSGFVEAALKQWLASPSHRKHIEGDYDLTGVGAARSAHGVVYFTQIFLKKR